MLDKTDMKTIGVILLNLGGPDSLKAVRPFLYNLFSDRQIIRLGPSFMQRPLAWLISTLRSKKTEQMYRLISGKSPILDITTAQAKALEEMLNWSIGVLDEKSKGANKAADTITPILHHSNTPRFKVYVGMRYWHPLIEDAVEQIHKDGVNRLMAISLYPHYSLATSGSSVMRFQEVIKQYPIKYFCIPSWFNHPLYIEVLIDAIKRGLESFTTTSELNPHNSELNIHVLFSAHSLPMRIVEAGDPYVQHIQGTIEEVTRRMPVKWHLSYQSRSGPVRWLKPSTDEKIKELAREGVKNLLIVPISFVSDHIETLYEIDILYKGLADRLGIKLNTLPPFFNGKYMRHREEKL